MKLLSIGIIEIIMYRNTDFWVFSQIEEIINKYFSVTAVSYKPLPQADESRSIEVIPTYEILRRSDLTSNMQIIDHQLKEMGFMPILRPHPTHESRGMLYIFPFSERMKQTKQNIRTPLILFFATLISILYVGFMSWDYLNRIEPSLNPLITILLYVIGLMGIVGIHELGHMLISRFHGIKASWPYFLPFPFGYGTLGAFISQKTPIRSRNDLFDIGLAGPIFGFVAALIATILGLTISIVIPSSEKPQILVNPLIAFDFDFYSPNRFRILLFEILAFLIIPSNSNDVAIYLHPLAFAGYIGLLLTGLNLIPIGQLDGGHIARSLFSEKNHRLLTYVFAGLLVLLGLWIFALIILLMYSQTGHAGPLDDLSKVSTSRKIIAALSLLLTLLCLPLPANIFNLLFPMFG